MKLGQMPGGCRDGVRFAGFTPVLSVGTLVAVEKPGKFGSQGGFPSPAPLCVVASVCRTYGM